MSLLEDVFLQDEANEAEELERVIEGDEFEERRRSDSDENSEKEGEAEEDKRQVEPTKPKTIRVVKNPRFILNPARLTGPRGIQVIPDHFKDFKFKGKGCEKEDLDFVLKKLEHWAYRLYPKFQFEDCLKKIEMLGKKRPVAVHLHKIRSDQFLSEDTVVQKESSDEDTPMPVQEEDEFDKLLQQQIELARSTPAPNSANKPGYDGSISFKDERTTSLMMPKATSSPSINDEQKERMLRSRRLAEERRLARLKNAVNTDRTEVTSSSRLVTTNNHATDPNAKNRESNVDMSENISENTDVIGISKKHNRFKIIDSSDEETVEETCVSVVVDVHAINKVTDENYVVENEKFINCLNNNDDHSHVERAKESEDKIEKCENIFCDSNSEINEGDELLRGKMDKIEEENDNIDNDMFHVNIRQQNVNVTFNDNLNGRSNENEKLRYDNSDMTDLNEHNEISDKNNESIINNERDFGIVEKKRVSNDIQDIGEELNKEALDSIEGESKDDNDKLARVCVEIVQDVIDEKSDKIKHVSEEMIGDIMDVDFNEDF